MATILRSSKYIRNFAEFATKIGSSHVKVDVQINLLPQRHSVPSSVFPRSLATQVATKIWDDISPFEDTLQKVDEHIKRAGRITPSKLRGVLDAFEKSSKSKSVTSKQALMVIRCCGNVVPDELPESRSMLVNRVWKSLQNSGIQLDLSHYNALLGVYDENEYVYSPTEILAELESKGIKPNKLTYQRLINRYCQQGDIDGASRILEYMRENEISINENIFTALVRGHSEANDMTSAVDILSVMRQAGLEPSADTYKELLCGYAKHGDISSTMNTITECKTKDIHLLDTDYLDVIMSLAMNGHGAHVETILSIMPKEVSYIQDALNCILKLANAGQIDVAMQVLSSIPNRDQGISGYSTLKQLAKIDLPLERLVDLFKQIAAKGIHSRTLLIALEGNLAEGNVEKSLALLEALRESGGEIREHYFWPIFVALGRSKNNAGINDLLCRMRSQYGQKVSSETLRDYVVPYKPGKFDLIINELSLTGIPSGVAASVMFQKLISNMDIKGAADCVTQYRLNANIPIPFQLIVTALAQTNDVESFVRILRNIHPFGPADKTKTYREITDNNSSIERYIVAVATSIKDDNCEILTEVLRQLRSAGYIISNECITTLQRLTSERSRPALSKLFNSFVIKDFDSGSSAPSEKRNIRKEISKLKETMNSFNIEEATRSKKRLLYLYCHIKDLPNLERIVEELKNQGAEFTHTMYKQILDVYLSAEVLDKSEEYIALLRQLDPQYRLNNAQIIKYTVLLVKNDRIEDSIKFVQEQQSLHVRDDDSHKNMWQNLLYHVADTGSVEAVRAIFNMLSQNGYIEIPSSSLGALVKVHLIREDLSQALVEFGKICETHNYTPFKNELAKKLILAEDAASLQRFTDLCTQVHGETNSLYELALSFIECNCIRQAMKILQIPALHSKAPKLLRSARRYMERGDTVYLERLISVIKNISFFKTMPEFYDNLITCYGRENNWRKGLELKQQMEEDEVDLSSVFLITLADLLERNDQSVPFEVPDSAKITSNRQIRENEDESENGNDSINPTERQIMFASAKIELMLRKNDLHAAFEIARNLLEKNVFPKYRTFRFLILRGGIAGEIELLEKLGKNLSEEKKRSLNYENCLCKAYCEAGKVEEYLNQLEQRLNVKSDDSIDSSNFPWAGVTRLLKRHPEFLEKYVKMSEKLMTQGIVQPMNALWIYHFIEGHAEADQILSEHLIRLPQMHFKSIIYVAKTGNTPELLKKLLKVLETAPFVNPIDKCLVHSELIKFLYGGGHYQESMDVLREALKIYPSDDTKNYLLENINSYLSKKGQSLPTDILPGVIT